MKRFTLLTFSIILFSSASAQSLRELYQAGLKAYEDKDYKVFKEKMYSIDTMRPNYPPAVYNLAAGYALLGDVDMSLKTLNQHILMDATQDLREDGDFSSLADNSQFKMIVEKQKELTRDIPVNVAYEFPILESHSECITFSKKQDAFFLGGVRDGKIWKIVKGKEPMVWADSQENSWAIMGIEISKDGKTLWACTSAMTNFEGLEEGDRNKASVLKYDLKKGTLLDTFTVPSNHVFGDMITDSKGNVFISDGAANQLYWISIKTGKLEVFVDLDKTIINLQGLTFNANESAMYLSDYIDGIYKLDMASKNIKKLSIPNNVLLKGIDGLYLFKDTLIGLHNGTIPNRVVSYTLNTNGDAIVSKIINAQAGILGEPTQGTVIDGQLFYIANSPWGAYDREGNFSPDKKPVAIGAIEF